MLDRVKGKVKSIVSRVREYINFRILLLVVKYLNTPDKLCDVCDLLLISYIEDIELRKLTISLNHSLGRLLTVLTFKENKDVYKLFMEREISIMEKRIKELKLKLNI